MKGGVYDGVGPNGFRAHRIKEREPVCAVQMDRQKQMASFKKKLLFAFFFCVGGGRFQTIFFRAVFSPWRPFGSWFLVISQQLVAQRRSDL